MGQTCSAACGHVDPDGPELSRTDSPDPVMYDLMRKSLQTTTSTSISRTAKRKLIGQYHLLYKHNCKPDIPSLDDSMLGNPAKPLSPTPGETVCWLPNDELEPCPTRLLVRRRSLKVSEEGGGTHIYAIRYPEDTPAKVISEQAAPVVTAARQEQCPKPAPRRVRSPTMPFVDSGDIFSPTAMAAEPRKVLTDFVTVSEEHDIYVADVGLTPAQCDHIVAVTEQVCRGQYAAYTYAKQTLGCREYPVLAHTSFFPVHTVMSAIVDKFWKKPYAATLAKATNSGTEYRLQLDDREPHVVKYDVTRKERQKLDMHTDKSEWTFLIALSNGSGVDYEGGGTYFECLDATLHVQQGHALIFPGKLRHCGQKITSGLRFILVGFLVDKPNQTPAIPASVLSSPPPASKSDF